MQQGSQLHACPDDTVAKRSCVVSDESAAPGRRPNKGDSIAKETPLQWHPGARSAEPRGSAEPQRRPGTRVRCPAITSSGPGDRECTETEGKLGHCTESLREREVTTHPDSLAFRLAKALNILGSRRLNLRFPAFVFLNLVYTLFIVFMEMSCL